MTSLDVPQHEKIFNEICSKLNELSLTTEEDLQKMEDIQPTPNSDKIEVMQDKIKKFQTDLQGTSEELISKIRSLEQFQFSPADMNIHMKQMNEQLNNERMINGKLNNDLAKSLELSLQLQLEIQSLKSRMMQVQSEEKKYAQAVLEKAKVIQRDLELANAMKDESAMELLKAKSIFQKELEASEENRQKLEQKIEALKFEKQEILNANEDLISTLRSRDLQIIELNKKIEEISHSFSLVESSAVLQGDALKNLMNVAENKIVEMKMALDKKTIESQDYYSHLQQSLAQANVLRQENANLKDYVTKLNTYLQQQNLAQQAQIQQTQANIQQQMIQPNSNLIGQA